MCRHCTKAYDSGMEQTMDKKKKIIPIIICVCVLAILTAAGVTALLIVHSEKSDNLARMKGVIATCDSTENEELTADKAIDGNDTELSSRWSSENKDAPHYIELEFPEEISVSFVVLKWERRNATSYTLEGSLDGERWMTIKKFDTAPGTKNQEIVFDQAAAVKYLRLSIYEVSDSEEDYSNFYKNVSLYEFEVYANKPAAYLLGEPSVGYNEDGSRYLVDPQAPSGYEAVFLGADYEQIIGEDGTIYPTIQDKEVIVGYRVTNSRKPSDTREISRTLTVPASDNMGGDTKEVEIAEAQERQHNDCPQVIPALAEWQGGQGDFTTGDRFRIIVQDGSSLWEVAELFKEKYGSMMQCSVEVVSGSVEDAEAGDFYLGYADASDGLGNEGYICDISDICVIKAETDTGVRWGTVTVLQILLTNGSVPKGKIRDYPLYEVRGFGIDVARKAVSLDTLYAMMEEMSYYKMNDLTVHLNDNVILSTSGLTDSMESALTADSAFRLESDVVNDAGQRLTSEEYAYTKEEFGRFIEDAKAYGVNVVPEIDTPAHSLSITKLYPSYALNNSPESADQINLGNADAVALINEIWQETFSEESGAFRGAQIVNIGMDEYYGDGEQYRKYASQMADMVRSEEKTVRMWGSLSNMSGSTMPASDRLQMNIWSTVWADPLEMYDAGYSLINMQSNHLYVIAGGGYDYLDREELYTKWEPNKFYDYNTMEIIPTYSPKMLGAVYMIWNDMAGNLDVGISEYDLYDRFEKPLTILSGKLWGMQEDMDYGQFRNYAEKVDETMFGTASQENRIYDSRKGVEPTYEVKISIRPDEKADGTQVIAESDSAYGEWAFYAAEPESGRVGFTREGRTYTWDYTLPRGEWTELAVLGELGQTTLYVEGVPVGTLGNREPFEEYATFVFPIERIGEETGAFQGEVSVEWRR